MSSTIHVLFRQIDGFIRRYYLNLLLKGSLFFGAGFLALFLLFVAIETIGYLNTTVRLILFYSFIGFNAAVFVFYVLRPFLGMVKIGKRMSPDHAARMIGKMYPDEISDNITNALQLKNYLDQHPENAALVMAGLEQKAKKAAVVPFQRAILLQGNLRFLPYLALPLLVLLSFFLIRPALILEPTRRIVRYETVFERPRPFTLSMVSGTTGFRNEDHRVVLLSEGEVMPAQVEVVYNGGRFRMQATESGLFAYDFRNLQDDIRFYAEAGGFRYGPFRVNVFEKPSFSHFNVQVDYPAYTGMEPEAFDNMGDLLVVAGSRIRWIFHTRGDGELSFYREDQEMEVDQTGTLTYRVELTAGEAFGYRVYAHNQEHGTGDSLSYVVNVVRDQHPRIVVEEHRDDLLIAHLFYRGMIEDDFGFSGLRFFYRVMDQRQISQGVDVPFLDEAIDIDPGLRNQSFHHHFDMQSVYVQPGETVELFFEVYDNDPLSGPKSARSQVFTHTIPTLDELLAGRRESEQRVEEGLRDGRGEAGQARDQIDELRKQLLESERMGWEQREAVQELLNRQDEMQKKFEEVFDLKKESEAASEQFLETDDRIREKQEELQKLFEEVLSDEMKDLFDQIRQELDNMDREQVYEMLNRMEFEFKDLERQLDRALELFRQLAMERLMQESIDLLETLSELQKELEEETSGGQGKGDELKEQQEEIAESFEQLREKLEELREKNQELSRPKPMDDTGKQEEGISESIREALERMEQQDFDGARPAQRDAGQKMDELSDALKGMQMNMFQQQLAEDARAIRMILENLLRSSFAQEDLMLETRAANVNDPRFVELIREQRKIQSDLEMVEDSLVALARRQIAIQSYVTREIAEIHMNLNEGLSHMVNRRRPSAASRQQFVMTHINNLALMLNESLQDINQQMAMASGMGDDSEQGMGEPSFQDLRQMQDQLNEMLEQIREGHQPEPGESGEGGEMPMSLSEQMARAAASQEAIRNKLREITDRMRNEGLEPGGELENLQRDMERSELDMLRKELSQQTMMRQQRILSRLLEHERAEEEREAEERREGTTAKEIEISNPDTFFEYNRMREREVEMLRSLPPELRPFYRSIVERYFLYVE